MNGELKPAAEPPKNAEASRDERLADAIQHYSNAVSRGDTPNIEALVTSNPELGDELLDCLRIVDHLRELAVPDRLGKIVLHNPIGSGSFGTVYLGRDSELDRLVAVKILYPEPKEVVTERILSEARAVASLRHPGIAPLQGVLHCNGLEAVVWHFIDGETLKDLAGRRRLTDRAAAELIRQVAEALDYAHSEGVIHRDIKPANIILEFPRSDSTGPTDFGEPPLRPVLVDFGLARRDADTEQPYRAQAPVGTPAYMSPEQRKGPADKIDGRSDVYSLGVVLFELLTGELPPDPAQHLSELHPADRRRFVFGKLDDSVSIDLRAVCLRAIAENPEHRYRTAGDFAQDLLRWLNGLPVDARPIRIVHRLWRWCGRNPLIASLAVGVASLLVAVAVLSFIGQMLERDAHRNAQDAQRAKYEARMEQMRAEETSARLRKAQRIQYAANMNMVQYAWERGQSARATELLLAAERTHQDHDNTPMPFEWKYWWGVCHSYQRAIHTSAISNVAFSPVRDQLAAALWDKTIRIWDVSTGRETGTLSGQTQGATYVTFSPDGERLASAGPDRTLTLWDPKTPREVFVLKELPSVVHKLAFSPDGEKLAGACLDGSVRVWNATTGQTIITLKGNSEMALCVGFSPDGKRLATGSADRTAKIWEADTGQEVAVCEGHTGHVVALAFTHDGQRLITGSNEDRLLRLWSVATGRPLLAYVGHSDGITSIACSPNGEQFASGSLDGTVKVWNANTCAEVRTFKGHPNPVLSVAYGSGGQRLASASNANDSKTGEIRIWDASTDQEAVSITGKVSPVNDFAFNGDGDCILTGSGNRFGTENPGELVLWDTATGHEIRTIGGPMLYVLSVAFSPDSRLVASATGDGSVQLWDSSTGNESSVLGQRVYCVNGMSFSPDSKRLAIGSGIPFNPTNPGQVQLWDFATTKVTVDFQNCDSFVACVSFSPDGQRLAAGLGNGTVKVWDTITGHEMFGREGHAAAITAVAFSPDGNRLATASVDRKVRIWNLLTPDQRSLPSQEYVEFEHFDVVNSIAFSPDGERLATGEGNRYNPLASDVRVWDVITGQQVLNFKGQSGNRPLKVVFKNEVVPSMYLYFRYGYVSKVAFSQDGERLAAAYHDGTVKVWNAPRSKAKNDIPDSE